jgi:hypothetical protein
MTTSEPPTSGWVYVGFGILFGAIAGLIQFIGAPEKAAWIALGVGLFFYTIGTIAVGVTIGLRRANWSRRQNP